jgi:DNA modification methylase
MTNTQILQGDCIEMMKTLPEQSVNCCVTSPPYFGLRDYGTASWEGGDQNCDHKIPANEHDPKRGTSDASTSHTLRFNRKHCHKCGATRVDKQIGLEETPEAFVQKMVEVFREVKRVLRDDGTLWLNLGDSYAHNVKEHNTKSEKQTSNRGTKTWETPDRDFSGTSIKTKDLVGIPWRVAFALQADGWYLRQDIIWHKPNPMPESVQDRCTKAHEYIFLLSKSPKYYFDSDAIAEPVTASTLDRLNQPTLEQQAGSNRVPGKTNGNMKAVGGTETRNKRSVWSITTKPYKGAHFATFPPDLIKPCILAGCPSRVCSVCGSPWKKIVERVPARSTKCPKTDALYQAQGGTGEKKTGTIGMSGGGRINGYSKTVGHEPTCSCNGEIKSGVVLDPFGGSGTTAQVAMEHGRSAILCELNPDYVPLIKKRLECLTEYLI